jgi:phosphosulfolactate synthase
MNTTDLVLPPREAKPRASGLTIVLDGGLPLGYFCDIIESMGDLVDLVKFGWGTSLVTQRLDQKIACLRRNHIGYFFGGTLFEKYLSQHQIDNYKNLCRRYECPYVEISNGTLPLANAEKARLIAEFAREFHVLSEVGYKDSERSLHLSPTNWVECIRHDLAAGAQYVVTEARESGTSGICASNGEVRADVVDEILEAGIDLRRLIFEAPNKHLQTYFIRRVGANVNLANIAYQDIIPLETLRLGLRSDTFFTAEAGQTIPAFDLSLADEHRPSTGV